MQHTYSPSDITTWTLYILLLEGRKWRDRDGGGGEGKKGTEREWGHERQYRIRGGKSLLSLLSFYSQAILQLYELVIVSNEVSNLVTLPCLNSGADSRWHYTALNGTSSIQCTGKDVERSRHGLNECTTHNSVSRHLPTRHGENHKKASQDDWFPCQY